MNSEHVIVDIICVYFPAVHTIYPGIWGTNCEWPYSDIDIDLLLNPGKARKIIMGSV